MARYSQFDFYQQSPSALDAHDEDEMSVLDDKILDSTSSDLADPRRSSYDAQDAFSHRNSIWSDYSHHSSDRSRPASHLDQAVLESSTQFMPVDGPQSFAQHQHQQQQQQPWSLSRTGSGSCTPTAYDQYQSEVESSGPSATPFSGGAVGPVGSMPLGAVSFPDGMGFARPGGVAMSPQSSQGWMPAPMDLADATAQAKSASYRSGSQLTLRRDGVRKKNARFEIPAERTLSNIDALINQSNNDEEIKELKQQKRLLRNRQAALDSRQRKKQITEKLEVDKRDLTQERDQLREQVSALQKREAELLREKGEWIARQQQISQYVEGLHMEKNEIIRRHTLETAELRKKNNILMETVEKLEHGVKPTLADNHASEFAGFEDLGMDSHPWDEFTFPNGLPMSDSMPQPVTQSHSHTIAQDNDRSEKAHASTTDHPFSWNAFYMCLLFGAFIASNSTSLPDRSLPQLSEEYRAESANVLKAILASSPELAHPTNLATVSTSAGAGPTPTTITGLEMTQMGPVPTGSSSLDELHDTLVMPTEEQERAQVFTLNADQYNSLTTFEDDGAAFKPQPSSSLQHALAAIRNNAAQHRIHHTSTSDVYTRSLMWERVPEKVIRDFRRMVQEYGGPVKEEMVHF